MNSKISIILGLVFLFTQAAFSQNPAIRIGSKKFTESVILGEIARQMVQEVYPKVQHRRELGGTRVLWNALQNGDIDVYPEYSGTIMEEILSNRQIQDTDELPGILAGYGIRISRPLGFNNTYALGMKRDVAKRLGIRTISDLRDHPGLSFGFTNEFMDRQDGWPNLQRYYQLPQTDVRGLDHDLAYRGLASGAIQLTDLYSTDAEIRYYDLFILKDDRNYFRDYRAVLLYREDLAKEQPDAVKSLLRLENAIPESTMIRMNASVKIEGQSEIAVAARFVRNHFAVRTQIKEATFWSRLWKHTREHLFLVAVSLLAAILVSIPLGILAFKFDEAGQIILGIVGIIQTIPSLALIVFMIPLLGIGAKPAIVALFLYSLLPIVRNTHSGLHDISTPLLESAEALGLSSFARLRLVELPLASRSILTGIKTSAIINIGTATLGALIGAGGYGQPILTGIRLDDIGLILEGAVPAALLALVVQGIFEISERILVPSGLRIKSEF